MTSGGATEYVPLDALNSEAEEEQCYRKPRSIWQRVDATSFLTVFIGFLLLLLAVALLALFWHDSIEAIDGAEPATYWARVVSAGWATRLVTICTTSIRTVVSFQAGVITALIAGIVLETTGIPLLHSPFYSMLRAVKVAPSNLWTATNFQPHMPRFVYALVLTEVLVTAACQFLSTIFLSDFANGTFTQRSNSTKVNILNDTSSNGDAFWTIPPAASWTFAELSHSSKAQWEVWHDTGPTFRAFLPFEEEAQRANLRHLRGPVPVIDHRVVCASPALINMTLDATMQSYVYLSGQIPTKNLTYPLLMDSDALPYINFTCKLPFIVNQNNDTVGESSLCIPNPRMPNERLNWTVLNEDPLIQPDGFPETSTLFMILDVLSATTVINTLGHIRAVHSIRTDGPWSIVSDGSAPIEALRISACLINLATQTLIVGLNSSSDNPEPKTTWDHHTQNYNTETSRLQLGVSSPGNTTTSIAQRGILSLDSRSQWETFHRPADIMGVDPTTFFRAILPEFITFFNSSLNQGVVLSRTTSGLMLANAHKSHVDLFQDTLITTASPALALQALLARITQMAYYAQLIKLHSPVAVTAAFSQAATIPVQWTGFAMGMLLIGIHSVIVVVVVVWFVTSTRISIIGSYWQTVAQVVSKDTQPILDVADQLNDGAVKKWAMREGVVDSRALRRRWGLRGDNTGGRAALGLVDKRE
ncbi:unnamed protein product [Penicillium salamii]|nr:unnamed protein product [Penicillium salamii]CAG8252506.1 unnamed protein product [Penicillium salamii]